MYKLSEMLDMNGMTGRQLADLCDALYALLQERNVTVTLQHATVPPAFTYMPSVPGLGISPAGNNPMPFYNTGEALPEGGKTICTGDTSSDRYKISMKN